MTEVEKQYLIDKLEELTAESQEIVMEINRCKTRALNTEDFNVLKHVNERLKDLEESLKISNKQLSQVVKKLKKAK